MLNNVHTHVVTSDSRLYAGDVNFFISFFAYFFLLPRGGNLIYCKVRIVTGYLQNSDKKTF